MSETSQITTDNPDAVPMPERAQPGKHLLVQLADERYALPGRCVQEVIQLQPISRVPNTPAHIAGAINLRGRIVPVIDLRTRLGLPLKELTQLACIVILRITDQEETLIAGGLVDAVDEVVDLPAEQIKPAPDLGDKADQRFIVAATGGEDTDQMLLILDIEAALLSDADPVNQSLAGV